MTVADALTQLLIELGVPPEQIPATVGRKVTLYQTTLYGTRTLVVLDNAASPDQVRPLLPEAPGCFAIVTSRRMGDPDTGEHVRLSPLPPDDAVALFRALTDPPGCAAGRPRWPGWSSGAASCRCRSRWRPRCSAGTTGGRWSTCSACWRRAGRGAPEDGTAAVRVSYQQLDEPQQAMFRLLGHLPGPDLDVAGAAALAGCDVTGARVLLDDLHEVSLLEEVAPERYQMLDPLKEFAAAEPPTAERADALLRLLDFYLVTLAAAVGVAYPFDRTRCPR